MDLLDIFNSEGMRGAYEIVKKMSIVGVIVQWFLSVMGLMTIASTVLRTSATIFYLSNRSLFDDVDRAKGNTGHSIREAKGFDILYEIFKIICPNIKSYSDYGSAQFNLDEDDTMTTYIIKSAPTTIITLLFAAMCYNGLLFQIYANIAEGLMAVATQVKDLQIAKSVNAWFAQGKEYTITIDTDGLPKNKLKGKIAKYMYRDVVSKVSAITAEEKTTWGSQIESVVANDKGIWAKIKQAGNNHNDVKQYYGGHASKQNQYRDKEDFYASLIDVSVTATGMNPPNKSGQPILISSGGYQVFVPVEYILGTKAVKDVSYTGYIINVSSKVPTKSTFDLDSNASSAGKKKTSGR